MTIDNELFKDLFDYHCRCNDPSPEAGRLRFALMELYRKEYVKNAGNERQTSLRDELENLQKSLTYHVLAPLREQGKCLFENRDGQYSEEAHSTLQETSGMCLASALQVNEKLDKLILRLDKYLN